MAKDKAKSKSGDQPDPLAERVDEMMNVNKPDPIVIKPDTPVSAEPEIDIFKDAPTAPKLPTKLLKEVDVDPAPASTDQEATSEAEASTAEASDEVPNEDDTAKLADPDTEKAVDDIVANESDELLAVEDAKTKRSSTPKDPSNFKAKVSKIFKNKWTWVGLGVVLVALFAVPVTRYKVLGLALKSTADITIIDSKTASPVTNAVVTIGNASAKTDGSGRVHLKAPLGSHTLSITKQYYVAYAAPYFVGFQTAPDYQVKLVATGRQVPIVVLNKLTGKPLAGAQIKVLDTTAKTDAKGKATIVLPTKSATDTATVTLDGYNKTTATIQVTDKVVSNNTIRIAPAGHLYFLSNLSGTIDLVKTNLDGTGRKVILAGTGKEDPYNTALLASRDWKYLVLESTRDDGKKVALYLLDTSTDDVTKFESSGSNITLIGWHDHSFLYDLSKQTPDLLSYQDTIKSYDADHQQTNQIDQSQVSKNPDAYQDFGSFYLLEDELVYTSIWTHSSNNYSSDISSLKTAIVGAGVDGHGKHNYDSFAAQTGNYTLQLYEPSALYFSIYSYIDNSTSYHEIEDGKVTDKTSLSATDFNKTYPTFLQSPSGNKTFWTDYRDGKNSLSIGDKDSKNSQTVASLSDYSPYGWYTDKYLLVTKSGSELYIMPASALSSGQQPFKVSNYYKPQQTYSGYGGGYGGI
jgi:hypothetical protein